jgi:hypothetical protein
VSPAECRFIADRLKKAVPVNIVGELFSFHDDAPPKAEMIPRVEALADINARAAAHGGYRVR